MRAARFADEAGHQSYSSMTPTFTLPEAERALMAAVVAIGMDSPALSKNAAEVTVPLPTQIEVDASRFRTVALRRVALAADTTVPPAVVSTAVVVPPKFA